MDDYFPVEGDLKSRDFVSVLYNIHKRSISGLLVVKTKDYEKKIKIKDGKIIFVISNLLSDSLGKYLLEKNIISKEIFDKANVYMDKHKKRFGRALLELGYLNCDQLWQSISDHLKRIIFSLFELRTGKYQILMDYDNNEENITLDVEIIPIIIEGIRILKLKEFFLKKFKNIKRLYVYKSEMLSQLNLKPYELHIFDLVKRESNINEILKASEILEFDTKRILYLFLILEIISTKKVIGKIVTTDEGKNVIYSTIFTSFEEALKYYNMKYELVYKVLTKEIGPISLSILFKAVEEIMENLPSYFQKIKFDPDGRINGDSLLKSVWYNDFDDYIGEFLKGLEEILYTEIFVVKKHLGSEFEQQVLKWIKEVEN